MVCRGSREDTEDWFLKRIKEPIERSERPEMVRRGNTEVLGFEFEMRGGITGGGVFLKGSRPRARSLLIVSGLYSGKSDIK